MMRELRLASTLLRVGRLAEEKAEAQVSVNALAEADAARDRHDWSNAALHYLQALKQDPLRVDLLVQLGHAYKELGDFDAALDAYQQFLEKQPHDTDIHLQLGHLYNRMNDPKSAFEWYARAQALAPGDPDVAHHFTVTGLRLSRLDVEQKGSEQEQSEIVR